MPYKREPIFTTDSLFMLCAGILIGGVVVAAISIVIMVAIR